ncbi:hypothetical protein [Kangiella sp.]|uniref:hypothetical protein n=1 Tax=Kangiella sp. TaxID=1920245 RepID=UPI0019B7B445|nr:hypothetical protein [Kangiella sp.]MBD3653623.1 hypothetical protein [Kangiella sp.]
MSKIVANTFAMIVGLLVFLTPIGQLSATPSSQQATKVSYVLENDGQSPQIITIWKSSQYLAISFETQEVIGLWQNWNSSNPTFFQVYPKDGFRIEFSRMESQQQANLLNQLKKLVGQQRLLEKMELAGDAKQFHLSAVEEGAEVAKTLDSWQQFATYDYADIGDNEAIPELARLIHQGFVPNF